MAVLFGVDVQAVIGGALAGQLPPVTLHKAATATAASGDTVATFADHAAEGVVSKWRARTLVDRGWPIEAVKLLIPQMSLDCTPALNDEATADGRRWRVVGVVQDAGNATWALAVVGVAA